jgi:hypothetical protein
MIKSWFNRPAVASVIVDVVPIQASKKLKKIYIIKITTTIWPVRRADNLTAICEPTV